MSIFQVSFNFKVNLYVAKITPNAVTGKAEKSVSLFCALIFPALIVTTYFFHLRWCVVNIYHVRFSRLFLQTVDLGPVPPAVLNLSDGGHVEDLGLLALLKKRLRKIVVVDGTTRGQGQPVSLELQRSLELARRKLRCSFSALDGRDIAEDLRCKLDEMPDNYKPRFYKLRVEYFEKKRNGLSDEKVGEGEVLLLLPRHPDEGKSRQISQRNPPQYSATWL